MKWNSAVFPRNASPNGIFEIRSRSSFCDLSANQKYFSYFISPRFKVNWKPPKKSKKFQNFGSSFRFRTFLPSIFADFCRQRQNFEDRKASPRKQKAGMRILYVPSAHEKRLSMYDLKRFLLQSVHQEISSSGSQQTGKRKREKTKKEYGHQTGERTDGRKIG